VRSKKDLSAIESQLLARKQELESELQRLYQEKSDDGQVQDPGDQAMSAIFESLKNSLQNNELEEYRMINQALEQIKKGAYGICVECSELISSKRLESYPNAARCVVCQEAFEEKNKKIDW
jgi:DnaK suppressor protein